MYRVETGLLYTNNLRLGCLSWWFLTTKKKPPKSTGPSFEGLGIGCLTLPSYPIQTENKLINEKVLAKSCAEICVQQAVAFFLRKCAIFGFDVWGE